MKQRVVGLALAGLALCGVAFGVTAQLVRDGSPFDTQWVQVARSDTEVQPPWWAYARMSGGELCIRITDSATVGAGHVVQSGCNAFHCPDDPCGQTFYGLDTEAGVPDATSISFGPVPPGIASVRWSDGSEVTTAPFPAWTGLPSGGLWVRVGPKAGYDQQIITWIALDSQGNEVYIPNFP